MVAMSFSAPELVLAVLAPPWVLDEERHSSALGVNDKGICVKAAWQSPSLQLVTGQS